MAKFYQRTQEINGVTYTAQFNGLSGRGLLRTTSTRKMSSPKS